MGLRAIVLLLIVLAGLAGPAHADRVFLVGLDGASWNVIDPMLERGELPEIARLIARGVQADLDTVEPVISPTVWTSIATGRSPEAHGITDFFGSGERRLVPNVFERLAARGRRVGVYDYLVTWPPSDLPNGFVIPGWLRRDARVTPPDVWARAGVTPFVADYDTPRTNTDYLALSRAELVEKPPRWNALVEAFSLEVGAVLIYTPDTRSHRFWRAAFPHEFDDPGPEVPDEIRDAIADGYRGVDRALGEITKRLRSEDAVVIVSDHGFQADPDGARAVWVTQARAALTRNGIAGGDTAVRVVGEFGAVAIEVDPAPADDREAFAARDRAQARAAAFFEGCRSASGEALFDVYAIDVAERPPGLERGLGDRAYQWIVRTVLESWFGLHLDPEVHGVVLARPRDAVLGELWPDATVQVGEDERPITSLFDRQEFTGTHDPTAILIAAGGPIEHAPERLRASALDVAPLLLYLAGETIPDDLEGRVPSAWIRQTWRAAHPVERAPASSFPELPRPGAEPAQPASDRALEEKLRSLGYVE